MKELIELRKELTRHDYRYYVLFDPIITDQVYDALYKKYEAMLIDVIGLDTKSNERMSCYPKWVIEELGITRKI